jgi:thymidylate synthase
MSADRPKIFFSQSSVEKAVKPHALNQQIEAEESVRAVTNPFDAAYHTLARRILNFGTVSGDRTGTGTTKLSGESLQFDLQRGFPLITSKYTWMKGVLIELLWFRDGGTNIKPLVDQGVHIWDEWADENGDLGPVYGYQWRKWRTHDGKEIDQLGNAIQTLKDNPTSRRNIVSAWNVSDIDELANRSLPPCHALYQLVARDNELDLVMYQRSADLFLGVPFNIASYATLTHMAAHLTGREPGKLTIQFGDVHIYNNHRDQFQKQLGNRSFPPPNLVISPDKPLNTIDDFEYRHFVLEGYQHAGRIKAPIAV